MSTELSRFQQKLVQLLLACSKIEESEEKEEAKERERQTVRYNFKKDGLFLFIVSQNGSDVEIFQLMQLLKTEKKKFFSLSEHFLLFQCIFKN